jgi:hypothetical protein
VSAVERPLLGSFKRVADRKLAMRFGAISGVSLVVALLDAVGLLLLVPLMRAFSEADPSADLPLLGELPVEGLVTLVVGFFLAKTLASAAIRWWVSVWLPGRVPRPRRRCSMRTCTLHSSSSTYETRRRSSKWSRRP